MNKLTCEVCGSTDIKKEDKIFVCESCGCKYSIEDVKKLLVSGEITLNENHNFNVNHQVSGKVEMVTQDDTIEKINKIIRTFDRNIEIARTRTAQEFFESWHHAYFEYNEEGFVVNHPELVETWLGLWYLQTMAFRFDRETSDKIAEQTDSHVYFKFTLQGYCHYIGDCIYVYNDDNSHYIDEKYDFNFDALKYYYSTDTILEHLEELSNRANLTEQQRMQIEDYKNRYNNLVANMKKKYAARIAANHAKSQKVSNDYSSSSVDSEQSSGGCYIATAVYGSYDCPEVWTLRRYRDYNLKKTWYGRMFVRFYYAISPTLVKWFGETKWFKSMWRGNLDQMIKKLQQKGYASTPYEDKE